MTFQCQVPGCGQTFDNQREICVHKSYHDYHEKIKKDGTKEIERLSERLDMVISCPFIDRLVGSDYLPQLPTRLVCVWYECEAEFTSAEKYYDHVSHHAHRLVDKCYWSNCNKTFKNVTLALLRDHLRVHTLQKLYACPHCGNFFSTKLKFDDHFLRHLSEIDFLANKNDLEPYTITHNDGELPYDLELYKINDRDVEIFRCKFKQCDKTFLTSSLLREHKRIHSGKNQCDQCQYRAKTASCLEYHKLYRHQTDRNFECAICNKTFKQRSDLRAHVRRHQIVDPYRCDKCDFETLNEDGLVKHLRLHEKLSYLCHLCHKIFNRGNNLSRHFKDMHQLEPAEGSCRFKYKMSSRGIYLVESINEEDVNFEADKPRPEEEEAEIELD